MLYSGKTILGTSSLCFLSPYGGLYINMKVVHIQPERWTRQVIPIFVLEIEGEIGGIGVGSILWRKCEEIWGSGISSRDAMEAIWQVCGFFIKDDMCHRMELIMIELMVKIFSSIKNSCFYLRRCFEWRQKFSQKSLPSDLMERWDICTCIDWDRMGRS